MLHQPPATLAPHRRTLPARRFISLGLGALGASLCGAALAQTITVATLASSPSADGRFDEWTSVTATRVALKSLQSESQVEAQEVLIKAGRFGDQVAFYLEWADSEEDLLHKPYVWDSAAERYMRGPQREDRLALQFEMQGDYSTDWLSGNAFQADMWHWKSSRSNPVGLAHDKLTTVSTFKLLRAYRAQQADGTPVYILRENDAGTPIYTTHRYSSYSGDLMPKYSLEPAPSGSITDIRARGVWQDGRWHLELVRALDTGHEDDVRFLPGQAVKGGIAVFDGSENEDHSISDTLVFQF